MNSQNKIVAAVTGLMLVLSFTAASASVQAWINYTYIYGERSPNHIHQEIDATPYTFVVNKTAYIITVSSQVYTATYANGPSSTTMSGHSITVTSTEQPPMEYFIGTYGQTAPNYYGFNIEAVGQNYDVEIDTPQVASTGQGGTAILCQGYISDNKFVCG